MNPRILFSLAILLMSVVVGSAAEKNQPSTIPADCSVKLHYGKNMELGQPDIQILYANAFSLLKSSNFNSSQSAERPLRHDISEIQEDYRQAVANDYLLISFKAPQKVKTVGGEVSVRAIIVRLSEHYGRTELFTIDDEGRVIAHGKYSGPLIVKLLQIVKKL